MKLSLVTMNEDFLVFLENRTAGMQVLNRYRTLTDERELGQFHNDFNRVDVFMFLDFQDLSKEFKEFLDYLHRGKSYLLNTEEVLLITYKDQLMSPTPQLDKNLEAIEAFMEKLKINLRIVRLDDLKFQDIYKSITASDTVRDNAPKKFIKYKVTHNSEGITIPPKKKNLTIVPDKLKGTGSQARLEDLQSASSMEHTTINVPNIIEHIRVEKDFKDQMPLSGLDTTVVFITGVRYSGKTTLALKCAKELEEQNLNSAVIDITSRHDIRMLNKDIGCSLTMLKGLSIETSTGKPVLGLDVFSKVYTSTFLTGLLRSVTTSRAVTFCEVDPEELPVIYKTFRGNKVALLVVPNSLTMVRDSIALANSFDFNIVPVVNSSFVPDHVVNVEHLQDAIIKSRAVFMADDIPELVSSILR